jgi:hypothetical protein
MILTHELAHIVLGHHLDTKLAFNDRMFFPDERTFERMDFARDRAKKKPPTRKPSNCSTTRPTKTSWQCRLVPQSGSGARSAAEEPDSRASGRQPAQWQRHRMSSLMTASPQFDPKKTDQVAALPLGGRVKVDPWNNQLELIKTKPVAITTAAEKMPFEVTPFFPFLTRLGTAAPEKAAPARCAFSGTRFWRSSNNPSPSAS